MDLEPLTLPVAAAEPARQSVPVLAAVVPIAGGVVLWLITGSVFALCFAALGPLMIGASLIDGVRTRRRTRRRATQEEAADWRRAEQDLRSRHRRERSELRRVHPDAAANLQEPPLRDLQPVDEKTPIVIGSGSRRSALRVTGEENERTRAFRERAARLEDAPLVVPMGRGACLRGPEPVVAAAARALIVQLCLRHSPSQLALSGDGMEALGLSGLPHARRAHRGAWRLAVTFGEGDASDASAQLRLCADDGEVPEGVTTVVDIVDPSRARLRTTSGAEDIAVECLSRPQAVAIAEMSVAREGESVRLPDAVALVDLDAAPSPNGAGLAAAIGRTERGDLVLDLVEDGPHAIVTGMTGSGKSELLVTWIASIARSHSPETVAFVLADFKGGTAFDPLRDLPHVAAVVTDLDDEGARRGVESLTAELRRREAVLADLGARNIAETDGRLGRLVIVVDEFAALLQEHPDLAVVFTDIAARGRALGMHLILGTQRAAGVIRDALATNCPLRVSLRVTDAADSRLVIGSDDAAGLPGGAGSRGLAFVRRPQDSEAAATRIALTGASDLRVAGTRWPDAAAPPSPWLPPLPSRLLLEDLSRGHGDERTLLLGLCDEPERQRQTPLTLRAGVDRGIAVVGGGGSGRSAVLRLLAAQCDDAVLIPAEPESAWDVIADLAEGLDAAPRLVLCDDIDRLVSELPAEHGVLVLERLEKLIRSATAQGCTVVVTTARVTGQLARVIDSLPVRMLLRTSTKLEHLAAGGDSDGYLRDRPPGRARVGDREVQIAWTDHALETAATAPAVWRPAADVVGVVATGVRRVVEALRTAYPDREVIPVGDQSASIETPRRIIVGDAEGWQRQWALWQRIRVDGEMLVLAECPTELRTLAACRELPPYAETHRGRAWSIVDGRAPRRLIVPQLDPATRRVTPEQ
ncbi:FtsK/SpoIIIE domain-containing protein [Microbacterium abyssi]|uniref:FtsK/SpoIIIE domain-containing protein n=1 Tax=Microbacterium abyssi TaxID=2782166 RepID=UPI00188900FB|nr:FtsK/SpoIIIE domain-containing protein [Microbacterium sp. A18JL241]